ncbi:NYN domain-containing protein [Neorhodopirellula lusitana]|uniref:NYN domain-containing protein n=1 Tax=Neorhodopirellula lusitana TaxID=445327 RepID=UPI00384CFCED
MSIVLLIDGYNVIAPVAAPKHASPPSHLVAAGSAGSPGWLQVERERFLKRVAMQLDESIRRRTCVIFDAKDAPSGLPATRDFLGIDVRFAVDHDEADDLIEELIRSHPVPKHLTVVSSDHRVQRAAKRRRAFRYDSQPWYDDLIDGRVRLGWRPKHRASEDASVVKEAASDLGDAARPGDTGILDDARLFDDANFLDQLMGRSGQGKLTQPGGISDEQLQDWIDELDP